jgi:PAS domain S-box-containing protein
MVGIRARLQALDSSQAIVRQFTGEITFWSSGMARLYGFTAEEAVGRSAHRLLSTEFPIPVERLHEELLARGEWAGELVQRRRDGARITVASRWSLWQSDGCVPSPRSIAT